MRPWLSSLAATRAMVADGMTSTCWRGPNTAMPIARPAGSMGQRMVLSGGSKRSQHRMVSFGEGCDGLPE